MVETSDGFRIAEEDLGLRGPGEMLGRRQHGLPGFQVADLVADMDLLLEARQAGLSLMEEDPEFSRPELALLRREVESLRERLESLSG